MRNAFGFALLPNIVVVDRCADSAADAVVMFAAAGARAIVLLVITWSANTAAQPDKMEMIRLRPGMSLLDVESNNHVRLELAKRRDDLPVVIEKPVHIGCDGPRGGFDLPPTLTMTKSIVQMPRVDQPDAFGIDSTIQHCTP